MGLRFLSAGESHGPLLTGILEGLPAGLSVNEEYISVELARRQSGTGAGARMKIERDSARFTAGIMEGETTGAPVAFTIENLDHEKWRGRSIDPFTVPRPGHVDLAAALKYRYTDLRPGLERASARETAVRVVVGGLCKLLLAEFGIRVGGYVISIGSIEADLQNIPFEQRIEGALTSPVACPLEPASQAMESLIKEVMQARDTLGGVIEVVALGLPVGLGSHVHWDRRLEARLGAAVLSIQAIRGVEIGPAFENAHLRGTQAQDEIYLNRGVLYRKSTRSGGLEGGITIGSPLVIRAAMKPIATTLKPQDSVDLLAGAEVETHYERSDFCPVPRAVPIVEAMVAFILADALLEKIGGDLLAEMLPRFSSLNSANLDSLSIDGQAHLWWPE